MSMALPDNSDVGNANGVHGGPDPNYDKMLARPTIVHVPIYSFPLPP